MSLDRKRTSRLVVVALAVVCLATPSPAKKDKLPEFDHAQFNANEEVARWLTVYDWMAWHASDLVVQESPDDLDRKTRPSAGDGAAGTTN